MPMHLTSGNMQTQLIVALDVPGIGDVEPVLDTLSDSVSWYKVGLELFTAAGPTVLEILHRREKRVFLDLKLHDIPNTVAAAVRTAARHKVDLLTVHAAGGRAMLTAAAQAAADYGAQAPRLIAVTTLTSLSREDLRDIGVERSIPDQAAALGRLALDSGIDGLVCSVHELERLRSEFGPQPLLVTPGIRLQQDEVGDQKRVATPGEAARLGSSFLVVGRSLLTAPDPAATAQTMLRAIRAEIPHP